MGFISSLLSNTGPAKMMAAQNALVAKYMTELPDSPPFDELEDIMQGLLISGGMDYEQSVHTLGNLDSRHTYIMLAAAYNKLRIPPRLKGICFKDNWNHITRPLIALHDADKEILMVQNLIRAKHGITITLEQVPQ